MNIFIEQVKEFAQEEDLIACLSNLSSLFNDYLTNINWVGFYIVKNNELILGPFQGKVACTHISFDKGVLGYCYRNKTSIIVDDVHEFKDHIACDSASNSELVVPIYKNNNIVAMIDIDSPIKKRFTKEDQIIFEEVAKILENLNW